VGNWPEFVDDGVEQTREHNDANEITTIDSSSNGIEYDAAGNMTQIPFPGTGVALMIKYDAWNRLARVVKFGGNDRRYYYDGLGRRVRRFVPVPGPSPDYDFEYYYNANWQPLEMIYNDDPDPRRDYVWGLRYLNDLIVRYQDINCDGDYGDTFSPPMMSDSILYYCTDANFNVTALVNQSGDVAERVHYDPYGRQTILNGAVDAHDPGAEDFSVDANGQSDWMNERLFAGMQADTETNVYGLSFYFARHRFYNPHLGRWVNRDPIRYKDGMNLYQYVRSNPARYVDPFGLFVLRLPNGEGRTGIFVHPVCPTTYTLFVNGNRKSRTALQPGRGQVIWFDYDWLEPDSGPRSGTIELVVEEEGTDKIDRQRIQYLRSDEGWAPLNLGEGTWVPAMRLHFGQAEASASYAQFEFHPEEGSQAEGTVGCWTEPRMTFDIRLGVHFEAPDLARLGGEHLTLTSVSESSRNALPSARPDILTTNQLAQEDSLYVPTQYFRPAGPTNPLPFLGDSEPPKCLYRAHLRSTYRMRDRWFVLRTPQGTPEPGTVDLTVKFAVGIWHEPISFELPGASTDEITLRRLEE